MNQKRLSDALGLRLTRRALRVLKERGIFAHSPVSLGVCREYVSTSLALRLEIH